METKCTSAFLGQILRGKDGLAIEAEIGEPGVLCAKINKKHATKQFDGYVNKSATQSKIVCDIFSKGDTAFNTGDVLVQDEDAYFYFQDRTGDTFRYVKTHVYFHRANMFKVTYFVQCSVLYRNQSFVLQGKTGFYMKCNSGLQ